MSKESYLKVTKVGEIKEAKDGRKYQQLWFTMLTFLGGIQIKNNAPERSKVVWELGPPSAAGMDDFSKGDPLFNACKVGDLVEGSIETETVEEYEIEDSNSGPLNTYTMILFPHENKYTAFERAGHPIVDEDGVLHTRAVITNRPAEKVEIEEGQETY